MLSTEDDALCKECTVLAVAVIVGNTLLSMSEFFRVRLKRVAGELFSPILDASSCPLRHGHLYHPDPLSFVELRCLRP